MRRVVSVTFGLLLVLGTTAACEKVATVASSVSPCFRVLPQARAALGGQGTFVDVARVRRSALPSLPVPRLPRSTPRTTVPGATTLPPQREVCLVAYKGSFDPTRITSLIGTARTGRYAVVIVGVKTQRVRAVLLLDNLPRPLHQH
jgi:hypothetical protein